MNASGEGVYVGNVLAAKLEAEARRTDPVTFPVLVKRLRLHVEDGGYILSVEYGSLIWAVRKSEEHTWEQFFAFAMSKFADDFAELFPPTPYEKKD